MRKQIVVLLFLALGPALGPTLALTGCTAIDDMSDDGSGRATDGRSGYMVAVEPGETLDDVARRMRVSRGALIQANHLQPPYTVHSSQALLIPPPASYRVQAGDTVEGIAVRLGVEEQVLANANGLRQPYHMHVNQVLRVPGGIGGDGAPDGDVAEPGFEGVAPPSRSSISAQPLAPPSSGPYGSQPAYAPPPMTSQPPAYQPPQYQQPQYQPPAYQPPAVQPQSYAAPTALAPRMPDRQAAAQPEQAAPMPVVAPPVARQAALAPSRPEPPQQPGPQQAGPQQPGPQQPGPQQPGETPRLMRPVAGNIVSNFGPDGSGQTNEGINIAAPTGTPVHAAAAGTVIYAGNELAAFGNLVLVRHDGGLVTAYGHLDSIGVQRGASVTQGQTIGTVGQTGSAKAPQLHFEVREGSKPVDPVPFLGGRV
jgi:murein DD-endopeptidase MepM/ murein hydrolase activator NlpD